MKFEVSTDKVAATVKSMQRELAEIEKGYTQMYQALETLDGMWVGEAHDVFRSQWTRDHRQMKNLCQVLQRIVADVSTARKNYDTCEESIQAEITKIQI